MDGRTDNRLDAVHVEPPMVKSLVFDLRVPARDRNVCIKTAESLELMKHSDTLVREKKSEKCPKE